jgi:hypothetical protein
MQEQQFQAHRERKSTRPNDVYLFGARPLFPEERIEHDSLKFREPAKKYCKATTRWSTTFRGKRLDVHRRDAGMDC